MEGLIFAINGWIQGSFGLALGSCFLWGLFSVLLCPCHLAAIPLIIGYVGGQGRLLDGRGAAGYAAIFSLGLIITITVIGVVCASLGRILGDVSPYWAIPVGLAIIILGLSLTGALEIHLPLQRVGRLGLHGAFGALLLGLLYGVLSGACTFGFLAPILAVIGGNDAVFSGAILVLAFAIGHCLPILLAGWSVPLLQRVLRNTGLQKAGLVGRVIAGGLVVTVGAYLLTSPFFE